MELKHTLEKLKKHDFHPEDRVFTMYLNTEADRGAKPEWKIRFKNGLKKLKEYAEAEGNLEQTKHFIKLQKKVEKAVKSDQANMKNGCIVVATPTDWFFEKLQVPVSNAFYWTEQPQFEELDDILNRYPSAGVIMVGHDKVTVLDTFLGEVNKEWKYEWDLDSKDWKEMQGLSHSNREASGANHKDQFDKRLEVNQQRWLKSLSPILEKLAKHNHWEEIVLTGETQLTAELSKTLNLKNLKVISKNMNSNAHNKVLQEVYQNI